MTGREKSRVKARVQSTWDIPEHNRGPVARAKILGQMVGERLDRAAGTEWQHH